MMFTGNSTSGQPNQQQCHVLPKRSAAGTGDEGKSAITEKAQEEAESVKSSLTNGQHNAV